VYKNEKPVLSVLQGKEVKATPVWLMRQAGRYLPEYRQLREKADTFIEFCLSPDLASEATLQPLRRYPLDAAIVFADILLVPFALGQDVRFVEQEGPVLKPFEKLSSLKWDEGRVAPVLETICKVVPSLTDQTAFIGFAGSPWTVACYMIEGRGQTGFASACLMAIKEEPLLDDLMALLEQATVAYLSAQIKAGVDVIQLFDSHAGLLTGKAFSRYVTDPTKRIVLALKQAFPNVPIIGFPRGATPQDYMAYQQATGVDAVGLDQQVDPSWAARELQPHGALQGNLDPALLLEGGAAMLKQAAYLLRQFGPRHIFNLGHGVVKETPPEHVTQLVHFVKDWRP